MTAIEQLNEQQVIELLENDPESERLLGHVEAAVENLREIAGTSNGNGDAANASASPETAEKS
jgi:hypothetical protein